MGKVREQPRTTQEDLYDLKAAVITNRTVNKNIGRAIDKTFGTTIDNIIGRTIGNSLHYNRLKAYSTPSPPAEEGTCTDPSEVTI